MHLPDRRIDALAARMGRVAHAYRSRHPLEEARWRTGHYLLPICSHGRPAHKVLIWQHNGGCAWARKAGCTMCNFGERHDVPPEDIVLADFETELSRLDPGTRFVHLGPGGSVFQERELAAPLRRQLVSALGALPFLEGFGLETRAETIRQDRIEALLDVMPPHISELALGFGLESADELIFRVAVNKGERLQDLEQAIAEVLAVDARHASRRIVVDCYVLLKPPFLTEAEAIDDAIRSITWAYDRGVDTVTLFVNTIKRNTICSYLSEQAQSERPYRYETPYLYSALEVLGALPPDYRRRTGILGFTSGHPYIGAPRSCGLCWHVLHGLISAHNYTRDPALLNSAQELRCECRSAWTAELSESAPRPIYDRFADYIGRLEHDFGLVPGFGGDGPPLRS
jgi:radical SAM enzyme (TIGR01210 family)